VFGNFRAPDFAEHPSHSFIEEFDGKKLERTVLFEVVKHALTELLEEGAIVESSGMGGAGEGLFDPIGGVSDDLLASDFQGGEVSGEADHGVT
jgi:hypothetical protein